MGIAMVVEAEANQAQVRRILQSKTFRTSEVHRNLLNYLAEKSLLGEGDSLKEYTVGLDVFSKPESYDPRQDSVVRMHMARLRQKLGEY
jgi:DNA-binding IclR family transcriptional regulator